MQVNNIQSSVKSVSDIYFASFADDRMKLAFKRLNRQAKKFGFNPNRIFLMDEHGLDPHFVESMKSHLIPGSRGFGYWCWKPQVVLQVFKVMHDGDLLLYADAGCHLDVKGMARFMEYVHMAEAQGLAIFEQTAPERCWTKGDVFDYFNIRNNAQMLNSGQILGGVFVVKKSDATVSFFKRFSTIAQEHFNLIDDTPSKGENATDFRENRHDQSVFSLLCKELHLQTFSASEVSPHNTQHYPISAKRDIAAGWRGYMPYHLKCAYTRIGKRIRSLLS